MYPGRRNILNLFFCAFLATAILAVLLLIIPSLAAADPINVDMMVEVNNDDDDLILDDVTFFAREREVDVGNVDITIYDSQHQEVASGTTDDEGGWDHQDLENDDYTWEAHYDSDLIDQGTFDIAVGEREIQGSLIWIYWLDTEEADNCKLVTANQYESGVAAVTVTLYDQTHIQVAEGTTDYEGEYYITELDEGWYDFEVEFDGSVINTGKVYSYGPDPDADSIIRGQVTDRDNGDPIDNAQVQIYEDEQRLIYIVRTDSDGYYETNVQAGNYYHATFHRKYEDEVNQTTQNAPPRGILVRDIEMSPKSMIYGYTKNANSGDIIPDVLVEGDGFNDYQYTYSKPDGYYELYLYSGDYEIYASHEDYEDYQTKVTLEEDEEYEHDILMTAKPEKDSRVYGYVTEAGEGRDEGDPIEGAYVELYDSQEDEYYTDFTDSQGYYSIDCYGDRTYDMLVRKEDYYDHKETITVGAGQEMRKDVELEPHPMVYGHITDSETGDPIEDATVEARGENDAERVYTDEYGYYEMYLQEGDYDFYASHEDYRTYNDTFTLENGDELEHSAELEPKGAEDSSVYGRVTDEKHGTAIEGAWVILSNLDDYYETQTDENGDYSIQCRSGDYDVEVHADGYESHYGEVTVGEQENKRYDVQLRREDGYQSVLEGYVTDAGEGRDEGDPIRNAEVFIEGPEEHTAWTDRDGYYSIECEEGEYEITVSHEEYHDHTGSVVVGPEDTRYDVELEPRAKAKLYGYVTDEDTGDELENAEVRLEATIGGDEYYDYSDSEGYYEVEVPEGEYEVTVNAQDHEKLEETVDLAEGEQKEQDYELIRSYVQSRLYGHVYDDDSGDPLEDVQITMDDQDSEDEYTGTTDSSGYYSIDVPEGTYAVELELDGYYTLRYDEITIEEEEEKEQDSDMIAEPEDGYVEGTVTWAKTGEPIADVEILFERNIRGGPSSTTTDGDGEYSIYLDPGDYDVTLTHELYLTMTDTIEVEEGGSQTQDYALDAKPSLLSGRVTDSDSGGKVKGATVTVEEDDSRGGRAGEYSNTTTTDGNGDYEMYVPPGDYIITIEDDTHEAYTDTITMEMDEDLTLDAEIDPLPPQDMDITSDAPEELDAGSSIDIVISVTNSITGDPVANADLELDVETGAILDETTGTTDASGYFVVELTGDSVDEDTIVELSVTATKQGYNEGSYDVDITIKKVIIEVTYEVELEGENAKTIVPGNTEEYSLHVRNTGSAEDTFDITIEGTAASWGILSLQTVTLAMGEDQIFTITVTVPADTPEGKQTFTIKATSQGDPEVDDTLLVSITVQAEAGTEGEGGGDSPGFVISGVIAALGVVVLVGRRKKQQ